MIIPGTDTKEGGILVEQTARVQKERKEVWCQDHIIFNDDEAVKAKAVEKRLEDKPEEIRDEG